MSTLPPTTRMPPRPIWARRLARIELLARGRGGVMMPGNMPPPTEAEKHDAIRVLQQKPYLNQVDALFTRFSEEWALIPVRTMFSELIDEAELIFLEASE